MDASSSPNFHHQTLDMSDANLIRTEVNAAQRLKRRWTIGLAVVGSLALLSLVIVVTLAVKTRGDSGGGPTTLKRTDHSQDDYDFLSFWKSAQEATSHQWINESAPANWTQIEFEQSQREGMLEERLLKMEKKMKAMEEKLAIWEEMASQSKKPAGHPDANLIDFVVLEGRVEDLVRNLTKEQSLTSGRLMALERETKTAKDHIADVETRLNIMEEESNSDAAKAGESTHAESVSNRLASLAANVSAYAKDIKSISELSQANSEALKKIQESSADEKTAAGLKRVVDRLSEQERKTETAYAELKEQTESASRSQAQLDAKLNSALNEASENYKKVLEKTVELGGSLQSLSGSKGKCLVGRVSAPNCPRGEECWPYQRTISFTSTFESVPTVVAALSKIDTYTDEMRGLLRGNGDNVVLNVITSGVTQTAFKVVVQGGKNGGGNNHLFDADVSWIACA